MHRTTMAVLVVALIVFLGTFFNHNPQVARFAAKQAAIAQSASGAASSAKVILKEWDVPTPDSHPHDPALAPDGAFWYTGQQSNTLGRLDPVTGKVREFHLKMPNSGPHGLVADRAGNIWFTANSKGYIGKLNPRTGQVTEYTLPDKGADDPHTPVFDQEGTLWFTVQGGNAVGRLDPRTGMIILKKVPTPRALPYGIAVNSKGVPFFCEFGTNRLAGLTRKRWTSPNIRCRRVHGRDGSPSRRTIWSTTPTSPAGIWDVSIRRLEKPRSGVHQAVRTVNPTASPRLRTEWSGMSKPVRRQTES